MTGSGSARAAFYGDDKHHSQKQLVEEKVYFSLQLSAHTPSQREARVGIQGRCPDPGVDAETTEECCFLACSLWLAQPAFL